MADRQSNRASRNQQGNTSDALSSTLTTAGDILYNNNINVVKRLPIGTEDFMLTVSNGEANWRRSTGELFKIGYYNEPVGDWWNSAYGATGVPFNQSSITRYNHANKIYTNWKYIENTGRVLTKSTNAQGGYTTANVTLLKGNCQELWCTINTDDANLDVILNDLVGVGVSAITDCVDLVQEDTLSGVDLLLDEPSSLGVSAVNNLNTWLGDLKTELNAIDASLNITLPALTNSTIAGNYNFDYSTFAANVDTITINCCCQHVEFGYGTPQCPIEALVGGIYDDKDMCDDVADEQGQTTYYEGGVLQKYATDNSNNNMDKLVLALPTQGFSHDNTAGAFSVVSNLTRNKINYTAGYGSNLIQAKERDTSGELRWFPTGYTLTFCDGYAMRRKAEVVRQWMKKWELDNADKTKPLYEMIFRNMGGNNPDYYSP